MKNPKTKKITEIYIDRQSAVMWICRLKGTSGINTFFNDYAPTNRNIARILKVVVENPSLIDSLSVEPFHD